MALTGEEDSFLEDESQGKKIPGSIRIKKSKESKQRSQFGKLFRFPMGKAFRPILMLQGESELMGLS